MIPWPKHETRSLVGTSHSSNLIICIKYNSHERFGEWEKLSPISDICSVFLLCVRNASHMSVIRDTVTVNRWVFAGPFHDQKKETLHLISLHHPEKAWVQSRACFNRTLRGPQVQIDTALIAKATNKIKIKKQS